MNPKGFFLFCVLLVILNPIPCIKAEKFVAYNESFSLGPNEYIWCSFNITCLPVYGHFEVTCNAGLDLYIMNESDSQKWFAGETEINAFDRKVRNTSFYFTFSGTGIWFVVLDNTKTTNIVKNGHLTITLSDKAPPRVLNAYFELNDELDPTNLTFYAEVQDLGSGIAEVILYYYFQTSSELDQMGGNGAALLQDDLDWLKAPMMAQVSNETDQFILYMVTVDFVYATSNLDIIYRISTEDKAGNVNPFAFDNRDYPHRIIDHRFIYNPPGLPEWVLLVAGLVVFVSLAVSIVYVKFLAKRQVLVVIKKNSFN
ncbi:MAG: hypothetical protein ACXADY_11845 [Candidatus Hodarchaeales archaeon]|jgi:hypothetical protein